MGGDVLVALKVLHTGDLHLGIAHSSRNYPEDVRSDLVNARFLTLERLVETAGREECQLFVVAGDLFDRPNVSKETVLRALAALARFEGCVAVLPGNHDYYDPFGSLWRTFRENAAGNILVLTEERPYSLEGFNLDAVLYPAPCNKKHSADNRLGWIKAAGKSQQGKWHLGLAHGTVRGLSPDLAEQYFPMDKEELLALGLNHWFLGHTHVRLPAADLVRDSRFSYSGTPEADGFDCSHGGWAWITEFAEGYTESRALQTGNYRFMEVSWDVRELADLRSKVNDLPADGTGRLVKLVLRGSLKQDEYALRLELLRGLGEKLKYLEWDDTGLRVEITKESIAEEFAAGSFPSLLLSALAEEDGHALQLAYELVKKVKK